MRANVLYGVLSFGLFIAFTNEASAADKIGVFDNSYGIWYLDTNGDGAWSGSPTDTEVYYFGSAGDNALSFRRGGRSRITVVNPTVFDWYIDTSGGGGSASDWNWGWGDEYYSGFGASYAQYVTGIWPSSGGTWGDQRAGWITNSGGYDPKLVWRMDLNNNFTWDGTPTDAQVIYGSWFDRAVVRNSAWGNTGTIGYFKLNGVWKFDTNQNLVEDSGDTTYYFGQTGDLPVVGDWTGWGFDCIGVFRSGTWYIDYNCNGSWDGTPTDKIYYFGSAGNTPIVGDW